MSQKISLKIGQIIQAIEQPILFKIKLEGGLPTTYQKLDTPWFKSLKIDTVFDIGANLGQFTKTIHTLLPEARIYSFEPLPECFDRLQAFAKNKPNIQVFNLGIGDASGVLSFERNDFSASSSFLKMTEDHKQAFPFTEKASTVDVNIAALDEIAKDLNLGTSLAIKIDVQGYEDKVLSGGKATIQAAKILIVETSFVRLYQSQPLFHDIYHQLMSWGYTYMGMLDQLLDPNTGKILQGDAIFIKDDGQAC